jgi:hypothetical protein
MGYTQPLSALAVSAQEFLSDVAYLRAEVTRIEKMN